MENIINKMENKKGLIIVGIFLIFLSVVGATFAYWGWITNDSQRTYVDFTIKTSDLCVVSVDGGGEFNSSLVNVMPSTCTNTNNAIVREVTINVDFTTSDSVTTVNLWLYKDDLTNNGEYLDTENFRYALTTSPTDCSSNVVSSGTFKGYDIDDKIEIFNKAYEYDGEINIIETYYLYIWLDAAETDISTAGKSFKIVMDANCSNYEEVVTLNYDLNGGSGTFNSVSVDNGETVTISSTVPTKSGDTFLGWSTSADTGVVEYEPGDTITLTRSTTLYAVWENKMLYLFNNGLVNTDVTGGWTNSGWNYYDEPDLSGGASVGNYLSAKLDNATYGFAAIGTVNKVDLTGFDNLYITINSSGLGGVGIWVSETKAYGTYAKSWYVDPFLSLSSGVKLLDVSDLSGSYYIVVAATGSQSNKYPSINVSSVLLTNDTISDLVLPTCSVTSNSSSTTITASYSDNVGVTGYYFGTTIPNSSSTFTSMTSSASGTITQNISATGTYYFGFKDAVNNISYCIANVINKEDSCCGYYHEWGYCVDPATGNKCGDVCPNGTLLGSDYCLNN